MAIIHNRLAIASASLGQHVTHTLRQKICATAEAGIQGMEITYTDLERYADELSLPMLEAACDARRYCDSKSVEILAFAPFENFEGQRTPLAKRLEKAKQWLALTHALGAAHLQVPSNYDRISDGSRDVITSELQQLSDLARTFDPAIKIAYENLGWGIHCSLWEHVLQIIQDVDRDNFGFCLDSFHLCVALWADPFSKSGIQTNGPQRLEKSLQDLVAQFPLGKLFYYQLSDGEKLDLPYSNEHPWYNQTLAPEHVWSNEARPFPLETEYGGFMPVAEVTKAVLFDLRFTGWVSLETFDRRMREEQQGPHKNARRAANSWARFKAELSGANARASKL